MKLTKQEQAIIHHVLVMLVDHISEDKEGNIIATISDEHIKKLRELIHEPITTSTPRQNT